MMALGKWLLVVAVVLVAILAVSCRDDEENGPEATATPEEALASPEAVDLAELSQQYVDALNRGDLDGLMELWADDAVIRGLYECVTPGQPLVGDCVGKEAIRNVFDYHIKQNSLNITVTDTQVSGDTVTSTFEFSTEQVAAAGFERLVGSVVLHVQAGKITLQEPGLPSVPPDPQNTGFLGFLLSESILVDFGPGRDDDQTPGAAFLYPLGDRTQVTVGIQAGPAGVRQPIHIHEGSCADLGDIRVPLQDVAGGQSATMVEIPFDELQTGNFAINVHQSEEEIDVYVACADIPPPEASGE